MAASIDEYHAAAARTMSEAALQQQVIEIAQRLGYLAYHPMAARTLRGWRTATMGLIGWPDLALAREPHPALPASERGRFMIVELKTERGRLSEYQERWLAALRHADIETYVWRPSHLVSGEIVAVLSGERRTA